MDPFLANWGDAAPEHVNDEKRLAALVVSHDFSDGTTRTLRFAASRVEYTLRCLPKGWGVVVTIDDRGQTLAPGAREKLRTRLLELKTTRVIFMSEGES
jgi:hypothetical protein